MSSRTVLTRVKGRGHGLMHRMFSPGDLGATLKPFVFLDFLSGDVKAEGLNFGFHPHSGIGTLTYSLNAAVNYTDTEGVEGVLEPGGLEWMSAGGGAWHRSSFKGPISKMVAFQFWFALPKDVEDGPSASMYITPNAVPVSDQFKVLIGRYAGLSSIIPSPNNVTVLDLVLPGTEFTYQYPPGHTASFVFVYSGSALVGDDVRPSTNEEIFVIENSEAQALTIKSLHADTRVLVASGVPHPHPLSLGMYSVHTNPVSLANGQARINVIGERMEREGRI